MTATRKSAPSAAKANTKVQTAPKATAKPSAKASTKDQRALQLRRDGMAFRDIARTLHLDGIKGANQAFNRGLRLQPKRNQQTIRREESARLDESLERAERDASLSPDQLARRRRGVEWHRAQLAAT
jgi:hypothetical protein